MKKITVAIAGLGSRGLETYARCLEKHADRVELVAVADIGHVSCRRRSAAADEQPFGQELETCGAAAGCAETAVGGPGRNAFFPWLAAEDGGLSGRAAVLSHRRGRMYLVSAGIPWAEKCRTAHRAFAL